MNYEPLTAQNIGKPGKYLLQPWGYQMKTTAAPIEVEIHEFRGVAECGKFRCAEKLSDGTVDDQIWRATENYRLCVP